MSYNLVSFDSTARPRPQIREERSITSSPTVTSAALSLQGLVQISWGASRPPDGLRVIIYLFVFDGILFLALAALILLFLPPFLPHVRSTSAHTTPFFALMPTVSLDQPVEADTR